MFVERIQADEFIHQIFLKRRAAGIAVTDGVEFIIELPANHIGVAAKVFTHIFDEAASTLVVFR